MSLAWEKVVEQPHPDGHLVQIYNQDNEGALIQNVSRFLTAGLRNGDAGLVVANARQAEAFRREIGKEAEAIRFLDSTETLARLMFRGQLDWNRFRDVIGGAVGELRGNDSQRGLRAYGDMVNLLWNDRQYAAAMRLELLWNRLLSRSSFTVSESRTAGFSLYCAYSMDVLSGNFQPAALEGVLRTHTHLIPGSNGNLETAMERAIEDVLGPEAEQIRGRIKERRTANDRVPPAVLSSGESIALWLKRLLPERSEEIFERARQHYREIAIQ